MLQTLSTFLRYGLVGIANTVLGFTIMIVLASSGWHYTAYTAVGYIVAFTNSYVLNSFFTFKVNRLSYCMFLSFVALNGVILLFVQGVQIVLIEYAGVQELLGVVVGAMVYTLTGFFMNQRLIYRAG